MRTALAIAVGTVPLAFLIGREGLGEPIVTGLGPMEPGALLAGATQSVAVPRDVNPPC